MGPQFVYQSAWGASAPANSVGGGSPFVVANIFEFAVDGFIVGVRYYRNASDDDEHVGAVFAEADNELLGVTKFKYNSTGANTGWQHAYLRPRVPVSTGVLYYVGVSFGRQFIGYTASVFNSGPIVSGDITCPQDSPTHWNGIFGPNFTRTAWSHDPGTRYGIDCLFLRGDLH